MTRRPPSINTKVSIDSRSNEQQVEVRGRVRGAVGRRGRRSGRGGFLRAFQAGARGRGGRGAARGPPRARRRPAVGNAQSLDAGRLAQRAARLAPTHRQPGRQPPFLRRPHRESAGESNIWRNLVSNSPRNLKSCTVAVFADFPFTLDLDTSRNRK